MIRDDLLEQIREPLWSRVDRRLVAVLAISIGAHLAVAIAAWLGDPPAQRAWLEVESEVVYTADQIPDMVPLPAPATLAPAPDQPGIATPVAPVAPARAHAKGHADPGRLPQLERPINASALISDLVGDGPSFRDAARHAAGKDLAAQIADANARGRDVRIGGDGVERPLAIDDRGGGPIVSDTGPPSRTVKAPEAPPPRFVPGEPPATTTYDPTDEIRRNRMRAIQRCYNQQLLLDPSLHGRVDLEFTISTTGHVTAARATGLGEVSTCVARLARGWSFPIQLNEAADFSIAMIFAQR